MIGLAFYSITGIANFLQLCKIMRLIPKKRNLKTMHPFEVCDKKVAVAKESTALKRYFYARFVFLVVKVAGLCYLLVNDDYWMMLTTQDIWIRVVVL
jgi:hypothetical protein